MGRGGFACSGPVNPAPTRTPRQPHARPDILTVAGGLQPHRPHLTWRPTEAGAGDDLPLFPTRSGTALSRDAIARLVAKHAATAARSCPSIAAKNVTPHTLRHSAAMALLHAGIDTSVIALWMGHASPDSTQTYLHADMTIKQRALARVTPPNTAPGRYQAPDTLLAYLDTL